MYHYSNILSKYTELCLVQDGCEDGVRYLLKFTSSADPAIGTDHKLRWAQSSLETVVKEEETHNVGDKDGGNTNGWESWGGGGERAEAN
jgi:hypothetical protein